MLRKVYAKVAALRGIKRLITVEVAAKLYKAYILPHLEYCGSLLEKVLMGNWSLATIMS